MKIQVEGGIIRDMTIEEIEQAGNNDPSVEEQLADLAEYIEIIAEMLIGD